MFDIDDIWECNECGQPFQLFFKGAAVEGEVIDCPIPSCCGCLKRITPRED